VGVLRERRGCLLAQQALMSDAIPRRTTVTARRSGTVTVADVGAQ